MAAYAATVTLDTPRRVRVGGNVGQITGTIDLTNYNSTVAQLTGITRNFKTMLSVVVTSSENGYIGKWNRSSKSLNVFNPVTAHTHTGPSHSHTIAVTAGTAGNAVTNNAGVLESSGGEDLTTAAGGTGATGAATAGVGTEVANDVDCGVFTFIAVGTV